MPDVLRLRTVRALLYILMALPLGAVIFGLLFGGVFGLTGAFLTVPFLIGYGALAARRAFRPSALNPSDKNPARLAEVLLTCAAMTWLNPHVYLDTVILLGSIANEHRDQRWLFGAGAVAASMLWFTGLGLGAKKLARLFATPLTWRILDAVIAVIMVALGVWMAVS